MGSIQSFSDVLRLLRRNLWLITLVTLAGAALSVLFALNQPKSYEATSVIQIETPQVARDMTGQTVAADAMHRLQLIEQRLMARDNLVKLIDRHDLFADTPDMPIAQRIYNLRISSRIEPITVGVPGMGPATTPSGLSITVTLNDPDQAAAVANDFVATVIEQNRERRLDLARETLSFYRSEEARVSAQIEALDARIAEFKQTHTDALPGSISALRNELQSLNETLLGLDQQIIALETEASRQRQEVFARQLGQLNDQRTLVAGRIDQLESALAAAPRVERELGALTREQTQLQDQLSTITRARVEAEMASMLEAQEQKERFEVLETAIPPQFPVSASRKKMAIAGTVASLLAGLALAVTLEIMNPTLRSAAQLEKELGITPVVTIPIVRLRHERRRRILRFLGTVAMVILVLPFVIRLIEERLMPMRLIGGD